MEAEQNDTTLLTFGKGYDFTKIEIEGDDDSILRDRFCEYFPIGDAM